MNELALFAGAGGGLLGSRLLGHRCVCAVEIEPYARAVLQERQTEGLLDAFPIWDDVTTFDGTRWRGVVDVVSGGFPCQDISSQGAGKGITGPKSGLWKQMARIIGEVQPRFCFIENSNMLVRRGLDVVLQDLASMGFNAEWGVFSGKHVGAPSIRARCWILAYANNVPLQSMESLIDESYNDERAIDGPLSRFECFSSSAWARFPKSEVILTKSDGMDNGLAHRMDRVKAVGNGQIPQVAAFAWRELMRRVTQSCKA